MWCPKCKTKSPTVAVGNDELICSRCRTEVVPTVPKPKSRSARKSKQLKLASTATRPSPPASSNNQSGTATTRNEQCSKPSTHPTSEQTVESAQAVVKAWTDSNRKWRADKAHLIGTNDSTNDESGNQNASSRSPGKPQRHKPAAYHLILFGLFIFLAGHALTIWAFLAGHFGAWTIGSFCSIGGVSIAIVSVVQALRTLEERIADSTSNPSRTVKKVRRKRRKAKKRSQ